MLNPGLSALWSEEEARRKLLNISKPLEVLDSDGNFKIFFSIFEEVAFYFFPLERTNILKIENEHEFKQRLISLLEKRFEESYPFKKVSDGNNHNII